MPVAAHAQVAYHIAAMAAVHRVGRQDAFLQADQAVDQFEDRARRLGRHHGPVVHRFVGVGDQVPVVLVDLGELAHVDAGTGDHRKDLAGRRFDGHQRTDLVLHQPFAVGLQGAVDGSGHVHARDGRLVVFAVVVMLLDAAPRIAQEDAVAFLTAHQGLISLLHAGLAHIVTAAVFRVLLDVVRIHF